MLISTWLVLLHVLHISCIFVNCYLYPAIFIFRCWCCVTHRTALSNTSSSPHIVLYTCKIAFLFKKESCFLDQLNGRCCWVTVDSCFILVLYLCSQQMCCCFLCLVFYIIIRSCMVLYNAFTFDHVDYLN